MDGRAIGRGGLSAPAGQLRPGAVVDDGQPDGGAYLRGAVSAGERAPPVRVRVELARTPEEQMRGLMFRRSLGPDAGMLFLFDRAEPRRFWMRNTYIPLDMIFLDAERVVVSIEENTVPLDETGRGPDQPAQFVVEVAGGYARSHGISVGSRAQFFNVP